MVLRVSNRHSAEVWVAVLYPSSYCKEHEGTSWAKKGWWHLNPGETATVVDGALSPQWFYYIHAHSSDGTSWGDGNEADCPPERFDWCDNTSSNTSITRRFVEIYSSNPNHTVNLTT